MCGGKSFFVLPGWDSLRLGRLALTWIVTSMSKPVFKKLGGFKLLFVGVGGSCLKVYWAGNGGLPQGFNLSQTCQSYYLSFDAK